METPVSVTTFYKFTPLLEDKLKSIQKQLSSFGIKNALRGLTIIGVEGINGTVAGSTEAIEEWKQLVLEIMGEVTFKDSTAQRQPFKRWFVKIRKEIVSLDNTEILPSGKHNHVSPKEWEQMMEEKDVVILDIRNTHETEIGMFKGAVDPGFRSFQDFPKYVSTCDIPKDKKVLMYCTGGIRCEKACLEMEKQGYKNVYQLDGGILQYIKEKPHSKWLGECFVFDHRVAVDQDLIPSARYRLCPHCGDPGDRRITCENCSKEATICTRCEQNLHRQSCSKNCAYHVKLASSRM